MNNEILSDGTVVNPTPPPADLMALSEKATPGPWFLADHDEYGDFDGNSRVILGDDRRIGVIQVKTADDEEDNANAELLLGLVNWFRSQDWNARPSLSAQAVGDDRLDRVLAFANKCKTFKANSPLGPLHSAGMNFAYEDVASALWAIVGTERTTPPQPADGGWYPEPTAEHFPAAAEEEAEIDDAAGLVKITMRLPKELIEHIDAAASWNGVVRPAMIRHMLQYALDTKPADGGDRVGALTDALAEVVRATRAYLPPDGISADELISRVIAATDNHTINAAMGEIL